MDFKPKVGKQVRADFIMVYGQPGIGKSSFAANAPNPYFIDADNGTAQIDTHSNVPENWNQIFEMIEWFKTQKYKTLVLDTLDSIEPMAKDFVAAKYKKAKFEDIEDHGKNWNFLEGEFKRLVDALVALRDAGTNVIVLAHAEVKTITDPVAGAYDVSQPKLQARFSSAFKDKVDCILFANSEVLTKKGDKRGFSDKVRYLFTEFNPSYVAKNRFGLPDKFELKEVNPFKYYSELKGNSKVTPEVIKRQIEGMLPKLSEEDQSKVKKNMEGADDEKLKSIKNKLEVFLA